MSEVGEFAGRTLVVTGGTGALGTAVVRLLLQRGARVRVPCFDAREFESCTFRDEERAEVVHPLDLSDEDAVAGFYRSGGPLWGSIHIAGGFAFTPLAAVTAALLEQQTRMNTTTCLLCCREAVPQMAAGGGSSTSRQGRHSMPVRGRSSPPT